MRRKIRHLTFTLFSVLLLISVSTGLTSSHLQERESSLYAVGDVEIMLFSQEEDKGTGIPVLDIGSILKKRIWVENTGESPCYLRVQVYMPQINGKPVFQLGRVIGETFQEEDFQNRLRDQEYWEAAGEYLYYRNESTQNVLYPGQATPSIYSALRINPSFANGFLEQEAEWKISISSQAVQYGSFTAEEQAWETFEQQ